MSSPDVFYIQGCFEKKLHLACLRCGLETASGRDTLPRTVEAHPQTQPRTTRIHGRETPVYR